MCYKFFFIQQHTWQHKKLNETAIEIKKRLKRLQYLMTQGQRAFIQLQTLSASGIHKAIEGKVLL